MAISRRAFVGGSALALGASATGLPAIANAAQGSAAVSSSDAAITSQPILVSVVDPANGTLEALVGEEAVTFTDRNLVRTLARLAKEGA